MISFIIPAHNEELWIGDCLDSIRSTMRIIDEPYETIVVDDDSTDSTQQIARRRDTRILQVAFRKISAVRNAGARAASGDVYFFVDADTQINERAVSDGLVALRSGAVGGGCLFELSGPVPFWGRLIHSLALIPGRLLQLAGGCFLFCTRDAFQTVNGFSEELFAGEDLAFIQALKNTGRFVVPKPLVVTSGRKLTVVGPLEVICLLGKIAIRGPHYESKWVHDILYGRRAQECRTVSEKKIPQ
jgi:glycosyltransferase involved in cell wall biosynthesis